VKRIGIVGFIISGLSLGIALLLLLNITALNPTDRRYSSIPVATAGNFRDIGAEGERVLSADLGVAVNETLSRPQCICDIAQPQSVPATCRTCYAYSQVTPTSSRPVTYRVPDFVTSGYIAEAKNVRVLPIGDRDLNAQLQDYALAARSKGVPLWIYVRVDTEVDAEYVWLARGTGGGVIRYFAAPGYQDNVDQIALYVGGASLLGMALFGLIIYLAFQAGGEQPRRARLHPLRDDPPTPAPVPVDEPDLPVGQGARAKPLKKPDGLQQETSPWRQAARSVGHAESFAEQLSKNSRRSIDQSNAEEDN